MASNAITTAREALSTALSGLSATVYAGLPELVQAPALVITPDEPYVTLHSESFGEAFEVHMRIVVATLRSAGLDGVDDLLAAVLAVETGWDLTECGSLPMEATDRPDLLATEIRLSRIVYL